VRPKLSACIVARDEEDRIGDCIRSVAFCDEVLVVDSHSRDRTREIAAELGARVVERDWPGFVQQKEFAIRAAAHDWVLIVDADERASATLAREIAGLRERGFPGCAGWRMPRCTAYLGRWIRHGGWYPDLQLRLFDRRRGRMGGHDPHDHAVVDGTLGRLAGDLYHESYRDLADHLARMERYTTAMAEGMERRGRTAGALDLVTHAAARFFRYYVLKRGFLDGWRGLLIASLAAHYGLLKYAKLLERQRAVPTPRPPDAQPGTFEPARGGEPARVRS